jgi:hypothetical protein
MIASHLFLANINPVLSIIVEVQVKYPHLPSIFPKNYAYSPILPPIDLDLCRFETIRRGKDTFSVRLQEGLIKMRIHFNAAPLTIQYVRLRNTESEVFVRKNSATVTG